MASLAELEAELQKRGETTSTGSVFNNATSLDEVKNFTTSLLKVWRYSKANRATRTQASGSSPLT
jgi:hypothetical protein